MASIQDGIEIEAEASLEKPISTAISSGQEQAQDQHQKSTQSTSHRKDATKPVQVRHSGSLPSRVLLIAVSFKEAALDSPTFRASMNHMDQQLEHFFTWLRSFNKSVERMSSEMDGTYTDG
jgi:hypothetical protein